MGVIVVQQILRLRRAYTFVEVLIAVAILVIGFVPVYMLIFRGEQSSVETVRNVQSLMYAHSLLEEVSHIPWSLLEATNGRVSEKEFKEPYLSKPGFRDLFTDPPEEIKGFFERSLEVIEGKDYKLIKVYVSDLHTTDSTRGKRGEMLLETMIVP